MKGRRSTWKIALNESTTTTTTTKSEEKLCFVEKRPSTNREAVRICL